MSRGLPRHLHDQAVDLTAVECVGMDVEDNGTFFKCGDEGFKADALRERGHRLGIIKHPGTDAKTVAGWLITWPIRQREGEFGTVCVGKVAAGILVKMDRADGCLHQPIPQRVDRKADNIEADRDRFLRGINADAGVRARRGTCADRW